jgi:hypothetical protein
MAQADEIVDWGNNGDILDYSEIKQNVPLAAALFHQEAVLDFAPPFHANFH